MKVGEIIAQVNTVKPNALDDNALLTFLNRVESMVQTEALHVEPELVKVYSLPEDVDTELILPPPHDQCYELYITSQIDLVQQEFSTYQNTAVLFNGAWAEMLKHFVQKKHSSVRVTGKKL